MNYTSKSINEALDLGVTPDQFRAEYEKRQSRATSMHTDDVSISYRPGCDGVVVEINVRGLDAHRGLTLSPATAIRWGESLAAAGRKAQK